MKAVTSFEIIENPEVVEEVNMPELGGKASLHEDGSVFVQSTGRYYAPEKEDGVFWDMRRAFDKRKSITPSDRYYQPRMNQNHMVQRYGIVA